MAKVLNHTKYHKINVADHRHHHQQQQKQKQQQQQELQQLKQKQLHTSTNQQSKKKNNNNSNNTNNLISHININSNEFNNYTSTTLQQHVANDQPHYPNHFKQQITSVSCLKIIQNKITTSISSTTTCSYSPSNSISSPTYPSHSSYSICCAFTYNMFTAYAEAATLQLKRKTKFKKLLHVSGHHPDMRSICYLILMAFFYWGVMLRAAVATNLTTTTLPTTANINNNNPIVELNTKIAFFSNLTNVARDVGERVDFALSSASNSSLKFPVSLLSSDDTLTDYQRRLLTRREAANVPDFDDDDSSYHDDVLDEYEILINNKSALGKYIGAPCNNSKCESTLMHVVCEKDTDSCGCEKNYPVQLGLTRGCDKPKKIGEQCFYDETCQYNDENSLCVQVRHNAMCQCVSGFHSVSYTKPTRRVFCTQDIDELNSDLPTLLGVVVGIGVLGGLICMVLHLFTKTKYPRHRNFADANLPPPIMYSSETVQSGRPSSRSSIRSSGGSIGSYGNRRSSTSGVGGGGGNNTTSGAKGILVSTSRTGSRRPSLASVHSTSSSVRSYSMMRFEKEQQQKEIRQEMKLRLSRLQHHTHQQHMGQYKPQIIIGDPALSMQHGVAFSRITMATPSPLTPNSTDELLPAVDENQEYPLKSECTIPPFAESVAAATISAIKRVAAPSGTNLITSSTTTTNNNNANAATSSTVSGMDLANAAAYIGPCSSSNEAL